MSKAAKVQYFWDTTGDPENPGWYARVLDEDGDVIDDSMKVWFPVDVDEYTEGQENELKAALAEAFPECDIDD